MGFGAKGGFVAAAAAVCNTTATVATRVGTGLTLTLQSPTVSTQVG